MQDDNMSLNSTAEAVLISTITLIITCALTCLCLRYFSKRNRTNSDLSLNSSTTLTTNWNWRRWSSVSLPPPPYSPPLNGNTEESLPSYERAVDRLS